MKVKFDCTYGNICSNSLRNTGNAYISEASAKFDCCNPFGYTVFCGGHCVIIVSATNNVQIYAWC